MYLDLPHRRFNPLTEEWVLVSPHRDKRPWLGQVENIIQDSLPEYDPKCYLCPGNERAGGKRNEVYSGTYVFDNDYPALLSPTNNQTDEFQTINTRLLHLENVSGLCRVVCFSPRHDLTLPELSLEQVTSVVRTWTDQSREICQLQDIEYIQVFENKGAVMGCSNPHPHSQIWATSYIPNEPAKEIEALNKYDNEKHHCMLCDILELETTAGQRLVLKNDRFSAFVPFWAVWPFEILIIGHRHCGSLTDLEENEITDLADILRKTTTAYDNLFQISFPYSMGFHQSPCGGHNQRIHHLHLHFYPPLLRSESIRKFMVGFEMLAMPQRDLTPEKAAERLRSLNAQYYRLTRMEK